MTDSHAIFRFVPPVNPQRSLLWRYGGAVLLSLAFVAARWLLGHVVEDGHPFTILFIPIAISAFYGGLGPGIVSVLTTIAVADYFLVPPLYTVGLPDTNAVVYTLMFAVSGLVISALGEVGRNALMRSSSDDRIRRVARQQSSANEERLSITEQVLSGGVWDWDLQRDVLYWSDGFKRMCDFPLDQQPSYNRWIETMHPDDTDHVLAELKELFAQKRHNWSMEFRIRTATGRTRWIDSRAQVIYDASGRPKRMVGINFDVTPRHFAQNDALIGDSRARTG